MTSRLCTVSNTFVWESKLEIIDIRAFPTLILSYVFLVCIAVQSVVMMHEGHSHGRMQTPENPENERY